MKSITFPEISKLITTRHRKNRNNTPSMPTTSIHDTISEIEREMDNLLELFQSYSISIGDKDMKSFITSLQQQIYRDITSVKEQMKDDNDEDDSEEEGEDDEDGEDSEDDEGNESTNFFIALQLRPINSTTSSTTTTTTTTTTTSDTGSNTNNNGNTNNKDNSNNKGKSKKSGLSTDKTTTTTTSTAGSSSSVKSSSMINPDTLTLPPVLPLGVKYIHEISILRYEDNQQMFSWFVWFKEYVDQNIFFKNLHYKMLDYFDSPTSYIV